MIRLDWIGQIDWIGSDRIGLDRIGSDWIGLDGVIGLVDCLVARLVHLIGFDRMD